MLKKVRVQVAKSNRRMGFSSGLHMVVDILDQVIVLFHDQIDEFAISLVYLKRIIKRQALGISLIALIDDRISVFHVCAEG